MDRRKYLKTLAVGSVGAGVLLEACNTDKKPETTATAPAATELKYDRNAAEVEREAKLKAETFFDAHEMKTITVLADIIIPKDATSGSASEAGVPDFIAFIVKDMPRYQTPLRGGLKWLDLQCMNRFNADFASCTPQQQIELVDLIAYPEKAKPEHQQGVAFFNTMRDLTATGFFTSKMGITDLGYVGNQPNQWNGVPQDVLDQYGLKYDERTLEISVKFDA
ncbi:gluconate 2-dehydrogenase subunit 3 family protein [Chryseolinea soli]|uniref:Gluconate 2-dehydrogenase subunit 3 family protein n=1 Tax=Chryseolinea soli TaxID=2321403 RepID=A0A385SWX3_9BACT|nr:gluconate 2-dehydrogenase subunit 3 family protein [Chryseolinea soli]AYB34495.1 gluconate 2-dehydrogenase subunit 3 family protein [Chryseolinea soli]